MEGTAATDATGVNCALFNRLTQKKVGDVRLSAVPHPGDHVVARRTFRVLEVWHIAGKGICLVVEENSSGVPAYMRSS